jgi:hypothetical protein
VCGATLGVRDVIPGDINVQFIEVLMIAINGDQLQTLI